MILLVHENNRSLKVLDGSFQKLNVSVVPSITKTLFLLAEAFPDDIIVWFHHAYLDFVNVSEMQSIFHHQQIMASYSVSKTNYIPEAIGFIDQSVFINVKRDMRYPTWLMSSDVGGISAGFLNAINTIKKTDDFDYFINLLAKLAMPQGLFCYSDPRLLKETPPRTIQTKYASNFQLFKFAKQHYKWVWVFMLLFCNMIYQKRFPFFAFIRSLFYKKQNIAFQNLKVQSSKVVVNEKEIDVIIPTIGRKQCLYNVLKDLASQTLLPKHVIIVEQNPKTGSVSELNYLTDEDWPFKIKHVFTHQPGACNARNTALSLVESEWVFLNDDDNRFEVDLLKNIFNKIEEYGVKVVTTKYLQKNEVLLNQFNYTHQTGIFGSGNSVVKTESLKDIRFNMALEFGYGEDFDFGVQLRNKGVDIIFFPDIEITHLKAPMGGFRTKFIYPWEAEHTQPKPSPTIMLTLLNHRTKEQILGYKLILFLRLIKKQPVYNYFSFLKVFKKQWKASVYWAHKLVEKEGHQNA